MNNTLTCNTHLQVKNDTVSSPRKICTIFNIPFLETVSKLLLHKKPNALTN
jgi:hypothetical protein